MRAFNIGPAVVTENAPKIASALSDGCCLSETLKRERVKRTQLHSVFSGTEQQLVAVMGEYFVSLTALPELVRGEAKLFRMI